jgi:hypothetical protein
LSSRTHDPHPVVRGSASAVVAAAYNQSGAGYIAYARQCRAFGLTLPSLRDKDKMWACDLLGAIGLAEWHAPEIRDLGALLERRKSINCWHPPARKILLRVSQTPVDATMLWRGEVLFHRIEDAFGEFAPN